METINQLIIQDYSLNKTVTYLVGFLPDPFFGLTNSLCSVSWVQRTHHQSLTVLKNEEKRKREMDEREEI